jgi:hypothetical protein
MPFTRNGTTPSHLGARLLIDAIIYACLLSIYFCPFYGVTPYWLLSAEWLLVSFQPNPVYRPRRLGLNVYTKVYIIE